MRKLCLFALCAWALNPLGLGQVAADEPGDRTPAAKAVQAAIEQGDRAAALNALRAMPLEERWGFLERLQTIGSRSNPVSSAGNLAGGAAMADFSSLMQLIQTTVDSNWDVDGGEDTLMPFFSGVWIDAQGSVQTKVVPLRKPELIPGKGESSIDLPKLGEWQEQVPLRWVSLTRIQSELESLRSKQTASIGMKLLGGLTRIQYLAWDSAQAEWLLGGPAGGLALDPSGNLLDPKTGQPPVLLEDLMSVAPHVLNKKGVLGCTIDPVQERLAKTYQWLQTSDQLKQLSRRPQAWIEDLKKQLGPQRVDIIGLPSDSPTGLALLIADQHMKRLGLGLEKEVPGVPDYLKQCETVGSVPNQGLIRWWFAIDDQPVISNEEKTFFVLPKSSVRVLSEQEWMDQTGKRRTTGQNDRAADAFAAAFSQHFEAVKRQYPIYGRLHHILDLTLVCEIIRRSDFYRNAGALDVLAQSQLQPHLARSPRWVDTIATHRKVKGQGVVGLASGGVLLNAQDCRIQASRSTLAPPAFPEHATSWWANPARVQGGGASKAVRSLAQPGDE